MKTEVVQINPTRVRVDVEVPFSDLEEEFQQAYTVLAQRVRVRGFRPGKAPIKLIEAQVGREAILTEVFQQAIPRRLQEALRENEIQPLGPPSLDITEVKDGESVNFSGEVDVRPQITLPDLSTIAVVVDDVDSEEEVANKQLAELQQRFSSLVAVDRPAIEGDTAVIDVIARRDGEEIPESASDSVAYIIGSDDLVDGLDEAILGVKAGETRTFPTKIVGDDEELEVQVTVHDVKERKLPELDDDFATLASSHDTLAELKEDVAQQAVVQRKELLADSALTKTLKTLLDSVEFDLPQGVIDSQSKDELAAIVQNFGSDEDTLFRILEEQGIKREEYQGNIRKSIEESIKTTLLLDEIAEKHEVSATQEDLSREVVRHASANNVDPQQFLERIVSDGRISEVYQGARRVAALRYVTSKADIKDADGAAINIAELISSPEEHNDSASPEAAE